jgi:hypothetical protein
MMITEVAALFPAKIYQHMGGIIKMYHINKTEITVRSKFCVKSSCTHTEVVIQ